MKTLLQFLSLLLAASFLLLYACGGEKDKETEKELAQNLLISKTWQINSVTVPTATATESSEWVSFTVSFSNTNMTTSGHPAGAEAVWPSGSYTLSDDGRTITRSDGVAMHISTLTETSFSVYFNVEGIELGSGRTLALSGDYSFNMK